MRLYLALYMLPMHETYKVYIRTLLLLVSLLLLLTVTGTKIEINSVNKFLNKLKVKSS